VNLQHYIIILLVSLISTRVFAKPEYAVKQNMSCTTCHVSPWGGGPRTIYGKVYGSRDMGLGKYSNQDLFYASLRAIAYYPNTPSQTSNGLALMEAAPAINAVVIDGNQKNPEIRMVGSYNFAPLGTGAEQIYARVMFSKEDGDPTYVTIGRFNPPFGEITSQEVLSRARYSPGSIMISLSLTIFRPKERLPLMM
jgi:hypothetical protein